MRENIEDIHFSPFVSIFKYATQRLIIELLVQLLYDFVICSFKVWFMKLLFLLANYSKIIE